MYINIFPKVKLDIIDYNIFDGITYTGRKNIMNGKFADKISYKDYDMIHTFSGGCLVLYSLMQMKNKISYNKVIFDSGPFFPTPEQASNYICNIYGINNQNINNILINNIALFWKLEGINWKKGLIDYNKWLYSINNSLCLHSINDTLLDYKEINKWSLKTNTKIVNFNNSEHVQLYRYEKDKYIENILNYSSQ